MQRWNLKSSWINHKNLFLAGFTAFIVTSVTLGLYTYFYGSAGKTIKIEHVNSTPVAKAVFTLDNDGNPIPLDFTKVADHVMDAVVHIKSTQTYANNQDGARQFEQFPNPFEDFFRNDPFNDLFGPRFFYRQEPPSRKGHPQIRVGQGSGVIISENGYIVTNNHVIADADDLEVTLHDNRTYKASIVGTDPTTDLALLQIKEKDLPTLPFVNSDNVRVGEWVMAVGNPFNLTSTVTAGIVSAKGRNINIVKDQFAVESFIQTDAAINPGNSGGALVNLEGGLIGINTAIASPTGSYSGYGFAVPTNIVSKVVEDLMKYGVVQRGVLGIMIRTLDADLKKEKNLSVNTGVFVDSLVENSAAADVGINVGDVITAVNDIEVDSSPELQEIIARHRPGDVVRVKVNRNGREKEYEVTLKNRKGNTNLIDKEHKEVLSILGADLETLNAETATKLNIKGGVKVKELYAGKLRKSTNMRQGFIITKVDEKEVLTLEDFIQILEEKKGGVMLEGIYEDLPGAFYFAFGM